MKRFVAVVSLILCLSFPVLSGHNQAGGGFATCECTPVEGVCPCCGYIRLAAEPDQENDTVTQDTVTTGERETSPEWEAALTVILWWLRLTA
jgi:hypothetical protein